MAMPKKPDEEKVKRVGLSFHPKVLKRLNEERGNQHLATFINDHFVEFYHINLKGGKRI